MISARATSDFAALAARLERQAKAIGEARAEASKLAKTAPAVRWRRAALLWPLFTKG